MGYIVALSLLLPNSEHETLIWQNNYITHYQISSKNKKGAKAPFLFLV